MATLAQQLIQETKAAIYARGLAVATALGLNVTSWVAGDQTRSLYHFVSTILAALEVNVAGFMSSGFLDYATGDWLTLLAQQLFGVDRVLATYASTQVTLTNTGGGFYSIDVGAVTVKSSTNGKTYRNTSAGTLGPVGGGADVVTLDFTADEPGSASSASAAAIDALVTSMLGVTCTNATGAVGLDEEDDASLRDRCRAKLGTLSPNGPWDAYSFVVRSSALTGVTEITRARVVADSATGDVIVIVAGESGPVAGASVTAAQTAVEEWAAPLCITPAVSNASASPIAITYEIWIYDSVGETTAAIKAKIEDDLTAMFSARPIGGDIIAPATTGKLYQSLVASTIKAAWPSHIFRVSVTSPAIDTALGIDEVATISGTPTGTVNFEVTP